MNKRKCKVFMFPTNETVTRILYSKNTNTLEYNPFLKTNSSDKYQHIYITSDEKIKEGDWIQRGNEIPVLYTKDFWFDFGVSYNKVIATTDTSLKTHHFNKGVFKNLEYSLPQPPQEFIEAYVKSYNEGNPITEVMVEYELDVDGNATLNGEIVFTKQQLDDASIDTGSQIDLDNIHTLISEKHKFPRRKWF